MAMVGVDSGSLYRRTHSLSRLAWSWVSGRLAPFYIHQMNWVNSRNDCHDDSTINIVMIIIIIIMYSCDAHLLLGHLNGQICDAFRHLSVVCPVVISRKLSKI